MEKVKAVFSSLIKNGWSHVLFRFLNRANHIRLSKSRSSLRSEWVLQGGFDLTLSDSIDTAVCVKQQTGTEVCSVLVEEK